ncbi:BnaC07g03050D [Brassica napus]|uniref:BnaC07g03050D protein n=1 Tax=Brassica napus TaxID=3708 RepID=A0A078FIJ9_BRANA|nr:BnaC07g03050D [Brassica napus]
MNSDLPASFVGGRVRPCRSEAIPMAPLKQRERFTLDDGLRSEIREGGLKAKRKKYGIHSSLHGLETGIHEVLYSYHFAPWRIVPWFYHLQPRDGAPLVEEPQRGIRSNSSFENNWSSRYVFMKIQEPFHYPTFWRTVGESRFLHFFPLVVDLLIVGFVFRLVAKKMLMISRRFRGVHFLMSKDVIL